MTPSSTAITRQSASNLALAFILLPKPKRQAMSVLYAFCREVDDLADDSVEPLAERRARLLQWREEVRLACQGKVPSLPLARELHPVIAQYRLPFSYFDELISGVEMDLDINRYQTLADLEQYCYRVASVVGLLSIEIFGYQDPACREYAVYLGKALQLTNILRDVRTDALRGRVYLPLAELQRHGVACDEILNLEYSDRFQRLAASAADVARKYYTLARETLPAADRRSMVAAELMGSVYWSLLEKLENSRFQVFGPTPTRLTKIQKAALTLRAWGRFLSNTTTPNYGTA